MKKKQTNKNAERDDEEDQQAKRLATLTVTVTLTLTLTLDKKKPGGEHNFKCFQDYSSGFNQGRELREEEEVA